MSIEIQRDIDNMTSPKVGVVSGGRGFSCYRSPQQTCRYATSVVCYERRRSLVENGAWQDCYRYRHFSSPLLKLLFLSSI